MTELETVIVDKLFTANLLKFYIPYVDDTLALIKESDINIVLKKLNSSQPSLKFTVDKWWHCTLFRYQDCWQWDWYIL